MDPRYPDWLAEVIPDRSSAQTRLSHLRRVEGEYGNLDDLYDNDELQGLIDELTYSGEDLRSNRPNPSRLIIDGNIRNNLASYKSAVQKYARFRQDVELEAGRASLAPRVRNETPAAEPTDIGPDGRMFSMERDLQIALRRSIDQLEPGLAIADGGAEKIVPSGRLDIFAKDAAGSSVIIELKAVKAQRDAVAQVLAYMGDVLEETGAPVRGLLVAPEFDTKAVAAAKVVPTLTLVSYRFSFIFEKLA
jgi:hypothetical protein